MYGVIRTLAGAGEFSAEGLDAWIDEFEGAPATQVELSRPDNAMADLSGNVYICDKEAHGIDGVAPDGTIRAVAGTNVRGDDGDEPGPATERRLNDPNGLWVRPDGVFFVLDTGSGKVRRVDLSGEMTTLFAVPGGIALGRGLWVSEDETVAFVSSRTVLLRWTPAGGVEVFSSGYSRLGNIAVDLQGQLVVTDQGLRHVFRLDTGGHRTAIAGSGATSGGGDGRPALETGLDEPRGVFFHPLGGFFVGEHAGSRVWYVDTAGVIHLFLDGRLEAHAGDGGPFNAPGPKVGAVRNVTVGHAGNVLVTESDAG
jgi:hypothetical protein